MGKSARLGLALLSELRENVLEAGEDDLELASILKANDEARCLIGEGRAELYAHPLFTVATLPHGTFGIGLTDLGLGNFAELPRRSQFFGASSQGGADLAHGFPRSGRRR